MSEVREESSSQIYEDGNAGGERTNGEEKRSENLARKNFQGESGWCRMKMGINSNNNNEEVVDVLCGRCGVTFAVFLHQIADQNEKVVCPNCRESLDCSPAKPA
ncbi:MAG: hypothetical protein WBW53_10290 [Terriglobales bacterium]